MILSCQRREIAGRSRYRSKPSRQNRRLEITPYPPSPMPSITGFNRTQDEDPLASFFESVSELTERIKRSLETDFAEVALHGEVSNVTRPRSGHVYFTLRDDSASIRAVLWKNEARRLAFELTDGLSVRSLGRISVYPPRGDYQVTVRQIEPEGIGALELAFRQRYARLLQEGLFDPSRKRSLPRIRVASSSSPARPAQRSAICSRLSEPMPAARVLIVRNPSSGCRRASGGRGCDRDGQQAHRCRRHRRGPWGWQPGRSLDVQ